MLGCQDFCGYYEWTFHYLRRRFGRSGLEKYWSTAIAADSQRHYIDSAQDQGLRGLYESWLKTGDDEQCDWTVTLDERHNLLRLDMRQCPSKGFLIDNGLNADEDYCDHCMGWIGPALHQIGSEVAAHEHNHCGQCWWEIRAIDDEQPAVHVAEDIRQDSRWSRGYLHRYAHHDKLPLDNSEHADSCDVLSHWFRDADTIVVLGPEPGANDEWPVSHSSVAGIVSGRRYVAGDCPLHEVRGVLLEHDPSLLPAVAARFKSSKNRPLLMHCYLPHQPMLSFAEHGLPRAVPILPLLIRSGIYKHDAGERPPAQSVFAIMLAAALGKSIVLRGVGATVSSILSPNDRDGLRRAVQQLHGQFDLPLIVPSPVT